MPLKYPALATELSNYYNKSGDFRVTDHRVVDGATGARFLQTVKQYLENPVAMLV